MDGNAEELGVVGQTPRLSLSPELERLCQSGAQTDQLVADWVVLAGNDYAKFKKAAWGLWHEADQLKVSAAKPKVVEALRRVAETLLAQAQPRALFEVVSAGRADIYALLGRALRGENTAGAYDTILDECFLSARGGLGGIQQDIHNASEALKRGYLEPTAWLEIISRLSVGGASAEVAEN